MNKTIIFFTALVIGIIFTSCESQEKNKTTTLNTSISKIEVLDFHSTHRCMTCNAIEANTKFTLNTYFAKELNEAKITFQVINVDEKENEKVAEKFEASGTSLILNVIKEGKETQINLTDFAFMKGNDQEAFSKELKAKIDKELKSL
ncbi:nitrophenyl compound nitroreductase subunit ArsF family protein [Tenacibaculum sp. 1B UA]|uniref:nitrophenyl compound nitroreductase subunit ArsF family protein n=1 Tax=unclassified Tenacibaculum TaxID=2635139 RepID=UPI0026E38207|nr:MULTISPECIES: nitrophenyl compound nitroreductase subunit ArsF family protein [unclassified Tenacibaculum]MDO6674589.1 nitrophenyl compound nitroreductase subunit ArsF family protein [Tenacibaculum sp. 1_MG-2023]MDX8553757.1 nitrophenyl compound nitroreductase subunit ArsF family protein [Tenacibaculum sp. 1B UA]